MFPSVAIQDITWDFTMPGEWSSTCTASSTPPVSVRLGVGPSPPSVLVSAGEHAPAALAFVAALALQAMMLDLAAAEGEEATRIFWKVWDFSNEVKCIWSSCAALLNHLP